MIHVHEPVHRGSKRDIDLIILIVDIEALTAFCKNANDDEWHAVHHDPLAHGRRFAKQLNRNGVAQERDAIRHALLSGSKDLTCCNLPILDGEEVWLTSD